MATSGPLSVAIGKSTHFEYFDELRKVIERASSELFFVDPYLDAEFVSKYLPHAQKGVAIRLLTREYLAKLLPAVDAFVAEHGTGIKVRAKDGFHDRYVIVDGKACFQSGTSFKDGVKNSATTLSQITDASAAVIQTYEALWAGATVKR
jgi:hypothetical protein